MENGGGTEIRKIIFI